MNSVRLGRGISNYALQLSIAILAMSGFVAAQNTEITSAVKVSDEKAIIAVNEKTKEHQVSMLKTDEKQTGVVPSAFVEKTNPYYTVQNSSQGKQASGSKWEFAFSPYLYMTGLNGTVGARGAATDIDVSFGDVISNLDFGVMGTLQARKGRFVVTNDLLWMKLGGERDTPGGLFSTVRADVDMVIWDPEAGVRLYDSEKGSFDVLGGIRLMSIENNIEFGTGTQPGFEVAQRKTWAMPVVGVQGLANLSEKLFINGKFDIGGWGSNFTTQVYAGGGFKIRPRIALIGGYRYLKTDYSDNTGFIFDTTMNGMIIGAKFTF